MQHESVKKLFKEQIQRYSRKNQYSNSPLKPLILEWLKNKKTNKKLEICEFGGGAGQLLGEIQESYPNYSYTNVEIINDYKQFLVSKNITFVLGSVLDSHFPESSFDVIIMRDVLHHLIGDNYQETLNNQKLALKELKRLVRLEGAIFIEELTNESEIATRIIYYLTRLNSIIGINVPSLFISSNVIVFFLTSHKLLRLCNEVFGYGNFYKKIERQKSKWYFAMLHFFSGINKVMVVAKK